MYSHSEDMAHLMDFLTLELATNKWLSNKQTNTFFITFSPFYGHSYTQTLNIYFSYDHKNV